MVFFLIMFGFLTFFFVVSALIEKYKPKLGHETAATVVLGVLFSVIYYYLHGETQ